MWVGQPVTETMPGVTVLTHGSKLASHELNVLMTHAIIAKELDANSFI